MKNQIGEDDITELVETLDELPDHMEGYSKSMRSVYIEESTGTSEIEVRFRELRDFTRDDGVVYMNGMLPITEKFLSYLQVFFNDYLLLTFEEWQEFLPLIVKEITTHREVAEVLVKMHTDFQVPLKQRQDEAGVLVRDLKEIAEEYKRRQAELEEKAKNKRKWAIGLAFIPWVNVVASSILKKSLNGDIDSAKAQANEARKVEASAFTIEQTLLPAMNFFIEGLRIASGFLSVLHAELIMLEEQGSSGSESELHFKRMEARAEEIVASCRIFQALIPTIESDLGTLPTEEINETYVQEWLEKQKEDIRQGVSDENTVKKLIAEMGQAMKKNKIGRFRK